jgi:hypothetical protein
MEGGARGLNGDGSIIPPTVQNEGKVKTDVVFRIREVQWNEES